MRQLFLQRGALVVGQVSAPMLDDHLVLVMVYYSFISSDTDLIAVAHVQRGITFNIPQKIKKVIESVAVHGIGATKTILENEFKGHVHAFGNACSGVVIAVGKKVTRVRVGDFVACAGTGYAYHADMVCVPEYLVARVYNRAYLSHASVAAFGTIALQGIRRAHAQLGEFVCVIGLDLIGQLMVQLAKRAGCIVIGLDVYDDRLTCAQRLGADVVIRVDHERAEQEIALLTGHHGVDITLLSGSALSIGDVQRAMNVTRVKGKIGLVGGNELCGQRATVQSKEIDFFVSNSYGPGHDDNSYEQQSRDYPYAYVRWTENRNMQAFVNLIERGDIAIEPLIAREVAIDQVSTISAQMISKEHGSIIVAYGPHDDSMTKEMTTLKELLPVAAEQEGCIRFRPAMQDQLRVGIVGAGNSARTHLMPIISRIKNVTIKAVVDAHMATSINMSQRYIAAQALAHDTELFQKDLVDVVVIASPHKFHGDQALRALERGKAVYVTKPMVTDFEQLDRLIGFIRKHPDIPFCVDYNRSFSSLIQKIKKVTQKRKTPLAIQYRTNAGLMPKENYIHTNVGAGRIIGEACHIFDLFCYLTESKPVAISVEALHAGNTSLFPTDNVSVQISFADGSICSLLYTALGHKDLGKERMEIFFDSKSIVMDDYDYLTGFGFPKSFDEVLTEPDKGHAVLLHEFFRYVRKETSVPPIDLERLETVARMTLIADKLACSGGGSEGL